MGGGGILIPNVIVFRQTEYPKLSAVLFGEGVLNDAMSILLFHTVSPYSSIPIGRVVPPVSCSCPPKERGLEGGKGIQICKRSKAENICNEAFQHLDEEIQAMLRFLLRRGGGGGGFEGEARHGIGISFKPRARKRCVATTLGGTVPPPQRAPLHTPSNPFHAQLYTKPKSIPNRNDLHSRSPPPI